MSITLATAAIITSLIGAAASGASTGIGASKAAKERKKTDDLLNRREHEAKRLYDQEYNKNFLDTDQARIVLNRSAEKMREFGKQNQNSAIKTGATQETKIANAEQANKNQSNLLGNLVAQGTQHKENIRRMYLGQQSGFDNARANRNEANAQSYANTGANIGAAASNLSQAFLTTLTPKTTTAPTTTTPTAPTTATTIATTPQSPQTGKGSPLNLDYLLDEFPILRNKSNAIIGY